LHSGTLLRKKINVKLVDRTEWFNSEFALNLDAF